MSRIVFALVLLFATAASAQRPPQPAERPTPARPPVPAGKGKAALTWYGHATFVLQTPGGATILVDPWFANPNAPKGSRAPEKIDAILVSHGHGDHAGEAAELIKRSGAKLIAPNELATLLGSREPGGNVGGSFRVKDATIHMVEALHSSSFQKDGKGDAVYAGVPVGFVIVLDNGQRIYHAGDTGIFAGMELIGARFSPDFALLPIGGHFTMGPEDAARAAALLKAKTVVPMHFGTFPLLTGTPEALREQLRKHGGKAKLQTLTPGKTLEL